MKLIEYETYAKEQPVIIDTPYQLSHHYTVYFNAERIVNDIGVKVWKYATAKIDGNISYDILVSAIVKAKYTDDDVTAIILNTTFPDESEEKRTEYNNEFQALQEWRKMAKEVARQAMEYAKLNMLLGSVYQP